MPQMSPFNPKLPDNLARSDSFGQQSLSTATSEASLAQRAAQGGKASTASETVDLFHDSSAAPLSPFPTPPNWSRETLVAHEELVEGQGSAQASGRLLLQVHTPKVYRTLSVDSVGSVYSNATDYLSSETHKSHCPVTGSSQASPTVQHASPTPHAQVDSPTDHWRPSTFGYGVK